MCSTPSSRPSQAGLVCGYCFLAAMLNRAELLIAGRHLRTRTWPLPTRGVAVPLEEVLEVFLSGTGGPPQLRAMQVGVRCERRPPLVVKARDPKVAWLILGLLHRGLTTGPSPCEEERRARECSCSATAGEDARDAAVGVEEDEGDEGRWDPPDGIDRRAVCSRALPRSCHPAMRRRAGRAPTRSSPRRPHARTQA